MAYQRRGIGADPGVNVTTIWTPSTGFLNTPGTLAGGYQNQPQVTSVYDVPGLLLPYQTCIDAMGGSAGSEACVKQNLATEAENFKRTAAYNAGTLKLPAGTPPPTPPPPPPAPTTPGVCTQPNYYNTSGICISPFTLQPIAGVPQKTVIPPTPPAPPAPTAPAPTVTDGGPTSSGGGYVAAGTDFITSDVNLAGFNIPVWGLLAAGAAALFFLGRHH